MLCSKSWVDQVNVLLSSNVFVFLRELRLWWSTAPTWPCRTSRASVRPSVPSGRVTAPARAIWWWWRRACRWRRRWSNWPNSCTSKKRLHSCDAFDFWCHPWVTPTSVSDSTDKLQHGSPCRTNSSCSCRRKSPTEDLDRQGLSSMSSDCPAVWCQVWFKYNAECHRKFWMNKSKVGLYT